MNVKEVFKEALEEEITSIKDIKELVEKREEEVVAIIVKQAIKKEIRHRKGLVMDWLKGESDNAR